MRFIISFLIIFLYLINSGTLLFSQPVNIQSLKSEVSLEGKWKIKIGDNKDYSRADFDDSSWDSINMPGSFLKYASKHEKNKNKICWLRKTIYIDKNLENDNIGLILGTISNADITYFNGAKIGETGSFPPDEESMWNFPRHYLVQKKLLNSGGKNVISIKISYYLFGDMVGKIAVSNYRDWKQDSFNANFFLITLSFIVIGIGFGLFILFLIYYYKNPGDSEYLFYCLMLAFGFYIILDFCNLWPWIYWNNYIRLKLLLFSYSALNVFYPIFLHRIYGFKRKGIERMFTLYLVSYIVMELISFFLSLPNFISVVIVIVYITIIGVYNISCHISAISIKNEYAKMFGFFGTIGTFFGMHDIIILISKMMGMKISILGYNFSHMKMAYTGIFIFVGTALVIVYRWINLAEEVIDLNINLENYIIENSLLQKSQKKLSNEVGLSENIEKKMQKVTEYINANYSFDISREGLAASVDVHPDNLSRMFKRYTNTKLGDFIYDLRIKEAIKKLEETDETIIEIAFVVGFESVRTFNRIFKKNMNTTPEKYRSQHKDKS